MLSPQEQPIKATVPPPSQVKRVHNPNSPISSILSSYCESSSITPHDVINSAITTIQQDQLSGHQALSITTDIVSVGITPESRLLTAAIIAQINCSFNDKDTKQSFIRLLEQILLLHKIQIDDQCRQYMQILLN